MSVVRNDSQRASATGTNTVTASYPVTPKQGDLLVAVIECDLGSAATPSVIQSGWIAAQPGTNFTDVYTYYKIAGASEPTGVTFGGTSGTWRMLLFEYSGILATSPFDAGISLNNGSSVTGSTGIASPIAQNGELFLGIVCWPGAKTFVSCSYPFSFIGSLNGIMVVEYIQIGAKANMACSVTISGSAENSTGVISSFKSLADSKPGNGGKYVRVGDGLNRSEMAN